MKVQKRIITPEVAIELLQKNNSNRKLDKVRVLLYTKQMKEGKWKEDTAETIKFSKNGVLLDGQHRLEAIVKSGVTQTMWFASDMDESVFDVLDTGKSRSAGDVFSALKIKNYYEVAATISAYHLLNNNLVVCGASKSTKLTNAEILEIYNESPEYWQTVIKFSINWNKQFSKILPISFIGSHYALVNDIDSNDALLFFNQLCYGTEFTNNSIYLLRKKFTDDKISHAKISPNLKSIFLIKVWNAFRTNKEFKILRYDPLMENNIRPI